MSDKTAIEWCDATWNPVTGCTKVSPGCAHCYIERTPPFRIEGRRFVRGTTGVRLHADRLDQPSRWRRPRRIFVNSLSDLFHPSIPLDFVDLIFTEMWMAARHTFLVLTKRPEQMQMYFSYRRHRLRREYGEEGEARLVLPNVWLGVSAENQHWADERIPVLLDTPAAVRFVSCEPLLGAIDLTRLRGSIRESYDLVINALTGQFVGAWHGRETKILASDPKRISPLDWVIAGGESGGPKERRLVEKCPHTFAELAGLGRCVDCADAGWRPTPNGLDRVRSLRDQCAAAAVPFLFKQFGGPRPTSGGRELDGRTWDEYPA